MGDDLTQSSPGGGRILDDARGRGVATVLISCRCNPSLICYCKSPHPNEETPPGAHDPLKASAAGAAVAAARDPFENLPPELLPTILSKLDDVKQAARTSILSSAWRHAWKLSPNLTLDIVALCKHGEEQYTDRGRYVQRFMDTVDTILSQRCSGSVVEQLELRFDDHHLPQVSSRLDDWIRFAVSSQTKSVELHVSLTHELVYALERYELSLQLLDAGGGISSLQHILITSVPLKVPSHTQTVRFPNLKSLGLGLTSVSTSDLQHMLSNCPNLECLDLHGVYLGDELRVHQPLPWLLCLRL